MCRHVRSRSTVETVVDPSANTKLMGLYRSNGTYCTQCEAEGFRRITYFLDRPDVLAVYTTRLEAREGARRRSCSPTAIRARRRRAGHRPAFRRLARSASRSRPICSRWSAALSAMSGEAYTTLSGRQVDARASIVEHGKADALPAMRMDSLVRSMRWDEAVFGREYDLDVFNVVAVSDFNMGAMENKGLNIFNDKYVLADPHTATDGDYANDRGGHRARIFPQLDRQPHHLPRLVPALPQGRPDRLPRPGILLRRCARARSSASPMSARLRARAVPRGCGPARPSGAAARLQRDQQLLHADRLREGRGGRPHAQDAARRRTASGAGMDLYFERHDGDGGDDRGVPRLLRRRQPALDLGQFKRWYQQAGTPQVIAPRPLRCRRQSRYRLDLAQSHAADARPARRSSRCVIPIALRAGRPERRRPAAEA